MIYQACRHSYWVGPFLSHPAIIFMYVHLGCIVRRTIPTRHMHLNERNARES